MPMPWLIASRDERILHRLAVDADLAGVGLVEAVENRHQRRFSGPVLADDAVDDAALDDEIDVIVGVNRAEALVDADQFDGGRGFIGLGGHAALSSPGTRFGAAPRRPGHPLSLHGEDQRAAFLPCALARGRGTGRSPVEGACRDGSSYVEDVRA